MATAAERPTVVLPAIHRMAAARWTTRVAVTAEMAAAPRALIICQYPLTAKKGTVPASVMSHLPAGRGDFSVYSIEESYPEVTGWDVNVLLMSFGSRDGGGYATGYAYW